MLPSSDPAACSLLSHDAIQDALGDVASSLGPSEPSSERSADGTTTEFCLYPFDKSRVTTNGLVIEILTYPSPQAAIDANPSALLMNAEDLPGLKHPAKFAVNTLRESTEFVVASLQDSRLVRLVAATPSSKSWETATGKANMKKLAAAAGL